MALLYLLFVAAVFYWQSKVLKAGKTTKRKAIALYAAYIFGPIILYAAVFMALVGIEELTEVAIIGEEYARSFPFFIVGGMAVALVATLVFAALVIAMKTNNIDC